MDDDDDDDDRPPDNRPLGRGQRSVVELYVD